MTAKSPASLAAHIGRTAMAALLGIATLAPAVTPARADHVGWTDHRDRGGSWDERAHAEGSRTIRRDNIGRYYVRDGRRVYIQVWDRNDTARHGERGLRPGECRRFVDEQGYVREVCRQADNHQPARPQPRGNAGNNGADAAIIAGIAGLVIGGIIASQGSGTPVQRPATRPVPHDAFPPAPGQPVVIRAPQASSEPWSPGWYQWCASRYRSFNAQRGTYRGYDGRDHFCVVK